jgi:hypothetical protein
VVSSFRRSLQTARALDRGSYTDHRTLLAVLTVLAVAAALALAISVAISA